MTCRLFSSTLLLCQVCPRDALSHGPPDCRAGSSPLCRTSWTDPAAGVQRFSRTRTAAEPKSFPPGGSSGSHVSADRTCPDLGPRPGRAQAPALRPGGLTRVGFSHFLPWDAQILPLGTPFSGGKPSRWSEFTHTHV